jgi:hypothetical protein
MGGRRARGLASARHVAVRRRLSQPDRVVLFAANRKLRSEDEWTAGLRQFVTTAKRRYRRFASLQLCTVRRGPGNQPCGDPKRVVEPMVDAAIARVVAEQPTCVHAGDDWKRARDVFEKGDPPLTAQNRKVVARQMAAACVGATSPRLGYRALRTMPKMRGFLPALK